MKYALYLGCMIPFRELSYEISARRVIKNLGIELQDMPDANCCGLPIDSVNHEMMLLLAARNLCIAEKMGLGIMTLCNGCTGILLKVNKLLKQDRDLKKQVNSHLSSIGMEFQGKINVKHFIQVLSDMNLETLKKHITRPLDSLAVAGFTGCHIFRPSEFMEVKNPENPSLLSDLIELTGARSVRYVDEFQCCGASEGAIDQKIPLILAREKLRNAQAAGADAMVTLCPACHQTLDGNQPIVERTFSESYGMPVLHYPQLLGLAMGITPEELALSELRVKPTKILATLTKA
ncbi:MAG: CoB--CoM heterodisulfide reductase iron-sulfur subunit B family protein [Candidatus Bathyarchaeota archaeon]